MENVASRAHLGSAWWSRLDHGAPVQMECMWRDVQRGPGGCLALLAGGSEMTDEKHLQRRVKGLSSRSDLPCSRGSATLEATLYHPPSLSPHPFSSYPPLSFLPLPLSSPPLSSAPFILKLSLSWVCSPEPYSY